MKMKKPKGRVIELLRSKGITRRWMINSVGIMTALLAVIWIAFVFAVHTYYYNMVGSYMNTEAKLYASQFAHSLDPKEPDFFSTAKDFVDGFGEKASMELLVMDGKGNVLLTSSGFLPDHKTSMPDLTTANQSSQGLGEWMGVDKVSGEKVIAVTSMLKDTQGKTLGTARYITSLTPIDRQIGIFSLVSGAICLAIIVFVLFSGMYFIRSIVVPASGVPVVDERIAAGGYQVRIGTCLLYRPAAHGGLLS